MVDFSENFLFLSQVMSLGGLPSESYSVQETITSGVLISVIIGLGRLGNASISSCSMCSSLQAKNEALQIAASDKPATKLSTYFVTCKYVLFLYVLYHVLTTSL